MPPSTGEHSPGRCAACGARREHVVGAGIFGSVGQGNYSAAKAAIAELTIQAAAEMGGYGIAVNAIAPSARTAMTMGARRGDGRPDGCAHRRFFRRDGPRERLTAGGVAGFPRAM